MAGQFQVVCGKCQVPPDIISNTDGASDVVCPNCGARDDANDAMRIAGEHFLQEAMSDLQEGLGGAVRSSKDMEFKAEPIRKRSFKWHAEVI
jgi:NMD protein affecting ribosome stability and mRNA decay